MSNQPTPLSIPTKPFSSIALALSGGGFRSAAFALGTMAYLKRLTIRSDMGEQVSLLQRVTHLSTVSGGSLTGALYALYCHKGMWQAPDNPANQWSFPAFYNKLWTAMQGDTLLEQVFSCLKPPQEQYQRTDKSWNLINAFARTYDQRLFGRATFGDTAPHSSSPLKEVCFNATEFVTGVSFRFQHSIDNKVLVGNGNLFIKSADIYNKLKLADIVAASSCFPSGFEPILFPHDFTHSTLTTEQLSNSIAFNRQQPDQKLQLPFGLMDGGTSENQGIYSLLMADDRNKTDEPFVDLLLIADVSSYFMSQYEPQLEEKKGIWQYMTPTTLFLSWLALIVGSGILWRVANTPFWHTVGLLGIGFSAGTIGMILLLYKLLLYFFTGKKSVDEQPGSWGSIIHKYIGQFASIRISTLQQMIRARLSSIFLLNDTVFLKNIRRLVYGIAYQDPRWQARLVTTLVYELAKRNRLYRSRKPVLPAAGDQANVWAIEPDSPLEKTAENAASMATTLWFDPSEMAANKLPDLIACGQFTVCYNLYEYITKLEIARDAAKTAEEKEHVAQIDWSIIDDLKRQLLADWIQFKNDPAWLHKEFLAMSSLKPAIR